MPVSLFLARMHPAASAEPAAWIGERLHPFARDVGSVIPPGFESYARLFHPPYKAGIDGILAPVRWRDIASANDRGIEAEMRRMDISCRPAQFSQRRELLWDQQPEIGRLPHEMAARLVPILARHTTTPESCWFAPWEGFGDLATHHRSGPKFSVPGRTFLLLHGRLTGVLQTLSSVNWTYLSPSLWWPQDRAWCVATEVDFTWTYIGGTRGCIEEVLRDPELEAIPTSPAEGNCMEK